MCNTIHMKSISKFASKTLDPDDSFSQAKSIAYECITYFPSE